MFTGIVEELGEVIALASASQSARLTVRGPRVTQGAAHGASIAVNGVCLTVTEQEHDTFTADVMLETLDRSSLGSLRPGDRVNLERPLAADGRFGGHVVQGHVDGVATVLARTPGDRWDVVRFSLPSELARYLVVKGSVTLDGVSLTVVEVDDGDPITGRPASFTVSLIPETLSRTTLGLRQVGEPVNVEVDVLAKYVERLLGAAGERPPAGAAGFVAAGVPADGIRA